jgi:hypothetical protein
MKLLNHFCVRGTFVFKTIQRFSLRPASPGCALFPVVQQNGRMTSAENGYELAELAD